MYSFIFWQCSFLLKSIFCTVLKKNTVLGIFVVVVVVLFLVSLLYNQNLVRDSQNSYNQTEMLIKEQMTKAYWMCEQILLAQSLSSEASVKSTGVPTEHRHMAPVLPVFHRTGIRRDAGTQTNQSCPSMK